MTNDEKYKENNEENNEDSEEVFIRKTMRAYAEKALSNIIGDEEVKKIKKDKYQVMDVDRQKEINRSIASIKDIVSRIPDSTVTCSVESESGYGIRPDYDVLKISFRQWGLFGKDMKLFVLELSLADEMEIVSTVGHRVNIILKYDKHTHLAALGE